MGRFSQDNRIVMTLDAGGTNLVFNAVQGDQEILPSIILPARHDTLEKVIKTIFEGFHEVKNQIKDRPVAISFAFPGPAEYEKGIIGDLENLPVFRGGVALGPALQEQFGIPVFINNDGDLFTYGEALAGLLPYINELLIQRGSPKYFHNLFGATFGTGFGGGIVSKGELFTGDNSAQGEVNRMRNKLYKNFSVEESTSIRGVQRVYARESGDHSNLSPKDIYEIGMGLKPGNRHAAVRAFEELAIVAGDSFANAITLVDGLVVIGGGLSRAYPLFLPRLVEEMNGAFETVQGKSLPRMEIKAFNLEDQKDLELFLTGDTREIKIPFSENVLKYDPVKRIGVGFRRLGTSRAVSIGAYAFALNKLDRGKPERPVDHISYH
jgi:glucokinase